MPQSISIIFDDSVYMNKFMDGIGLWKWEEATDTLLWSKTMYPLYERPPEKLVKTYKDFLNYVHPDDMGTVTRALNNAIKENTVFNCIFRIICGKKIKYIKAHAVLEETASGKVMLGRNSDVTAEQITQQQLASEREMMQSFFENSPSGAAIVNTNGVFEYVNKSFCKISGHLQSYLIGKTFKDITHPDDIARGLSLFNAMLSNEINTYSMDKRYITSNNEPTWVKLVVVASRKEDTTIDKFFVQIFDINDVKFKKDQMMESIKTIQNGFSDKKK